MNKKSYQIDLPSAILSLSRALMGEVSPALRAAVIDWDEDVVHLFFYYHGKISEIDIDSAECVATEVISDFTEHELDLQILRLDAPKPIPKIGRMVYLRRE